MDMLSGSGIVNHSATLVRPPRIIDPVQVNFPADIIRIIPGPGSKIDPAAGDLSVDAGISLAICGRYNDGTVRPGIAYKRQKAGHLRMITDLKEMPHNPLIFDFQLNHSSRSRLIRLHLAESISQYFVACQ